MYFILDLDAYVDIESFDLIGYKQGKLPNVRRIVGFGRNGEAE